MVASHPRGRTSTAPGSSGFRPATRFDYALRLGDREFLVDRPRLIVGRATASDVQLDGAPVSRRHALLALRDDGLWVEDLGSRNGVFVNGVLVGKSFRLEVGDFMRIGDHDVEVTAIGAPEPDDEAPSGYGDDEEVSTRRVNPLEVLGGIVEHALSVGDYDEAEAIVGGHLRALRQSARAGKPVAAQMTQAASQYALRLAAASGRGAWVDYVIELHLSVRRAMPLGLVRELFRLAPVARYQDRGLLKSYLDLLSQSAATLGPNAALVLQRMKRYGRL